MQHPPPPAVPAPPPMAPPGPIPPMFMQQQMGGHMGQPQVGSVARMMIYDQLYLSEYYFLSCTSEVIELVQMSFSLSINSAQVFFSAVCGVCLSLRFSFLR